MSMFLAITQYCMDLESPEEFVKFMKIRVSAQLNTTYQKKKQAFTVEIFKETYYIVVTFSMQ